MHDVIVLQNTTKVTYNKNVPIKKSQNIAEIEFEDSYPYRAELVHHMQKNNIYENNYRPQAVGGLDSSSVNI